MDKKQLVDEILFILSSTGRWSNLNSYDGTGEPDDYIQIDTLVFLNESLPEAVLVLVELEIGQRMAVISEWLDDIVLEDRRLYWKFPVWNK